MLFVIITAVLAGILPVESIPNTDCVQPPTFPYAQIEKTSTTHGSYVTYVFQDPYKLIGFRRAQCLYGEWISMPICNNGKCEEEPPGIRNGRIASFDRKHGSEVEYQCDESFVMERESSVFCNVDKWEGDPPLCQKIGYIPSLQIKPEQQKNLDREKYSTTTEVPRSTSSSVASDTCYCKFDYLDDSIRASSGRRPVNVRSIIRKGERVSLFCRHRAMDLVWKNGELSFDDRTVYLTCDTCKIWTRNDLPDCRDRQTESEIQCPPLEKNTNRGHFNIHYENNKKVHSVANFACVSRTQKLIGPTSRECMANGRWSGSYPSCEDITCPRFLTYNSLVIAYTNDNKMNSRATFSCNRNAKLIGENWAVCMPSGQWSNQRPTCENYVSCNMLEKSENLDVFYSNDIKVGSIATFFCDPPYTMVGNHQARCLRNGTWSSALPSCETPKCSVDRLFDRLPQEVSPDLRNVTDDYVPYGSELQFVCGPNSFLSGSSKAKCGSQGRWEHGDVRCNEGCTLEEITSTSQLLVETVKDYYLFGEAISFSCPPGQKLSSEIQRVMCLGTSWSDSIPDCEEAP